MEHHGSGDKTVSCAIPHEVFDSPLVQAAEVAVQTLRSAGHEAAFVGGFVRNALLGKPMDDVDIATSATPDEVAGLFKAAKSVGAHFGVMLVRREGFTFEVATYRAEGSYVDHRHPSEVRHGTFEEDWRRRDFTINAMYYDPVARYVLDPAGGLVDLEARRLRTVGEPDLRFEEDALRLLRAVRFAARFELEIEPAVAEAARLQAPTLAAISVERIAEELIAILTGPHPGRAMHLMADLALWPHAVPEIEPMRGCPQPPEFHPEGDVFVHTAMVLDGLEEPWGGPPTPALALAALLHDVGKPPTIINDDRIRFPEHQNVGAEMAVAICRRLRLPTRLTEQVHELVADHMRFIDAHRMKRSTLRRFLGREDFALHLALHHADCLASHGKLDNYHYCIEQIESLKQEDAQAALLPPPLLNGYDLLALGLEPGPQIGRLLEAVRDEQLEGRLASKEAALAWVREKL